MNTFSQWNTLKEGIDINKDRVFFNEREICFINLGKNIGYEQNGKHEKFERPVIIISKLGSSLFLGIPLTSTNKNGKFYFSFEFKKKQRCAILSQIRVFDAKRIERKLGYINKEDFEKIKQKIKDLI